MMQMQRLEIWKAVAKIRLGAGGAGRGWGRGQQCLEFSS